MNQGYHRSGSHEVMEITSACDLMAGERVEAASFHARGFWGFRKIQQAAGSPISLNADVKAFEWAPHGSGG
jgi:hypothetical protein